MPRSPPAELISSRILKSCLRLKRFCLPVFRTAKKYSFDPITFKIQELFKDSPNIQGLFKTLRRGRIIAVGWCAAFCARTLFLSDVSVAGIIRLIIRLRLLSSCVLRNGHHSCVDLGNRFLSVNHIFSGNVSGLFSFLTDSSFSCRENIHTSVFPFTLST